MYSNWRSTNTLTVFHVAFRWLSKADVPTWQQWHRLCNHLHDHVQPTCETSYLSQKKVCACESELSLQTLRSLLKNLL